MRKHHRIVYHSKVLFHGPGLPAMQGFQEVSLLLLPNERIRLVNLLEHVIIGKRELIHAW